MDAAALDRFQQAAQGADIALFFFAGHGMELNGQNLLLPIDARLAQERDALRQTIPLDQVMQAMPRARVKLVLLDSCRDNPLAEHMQRIGGQRGSGGRGLVRVDDADDGTLIAFATAPGTTAADGHGDDSPFTTALLANLPTAGDDIRVVLGEVWRTAVHGVRHQRTAARPWTNFNLSAKVVLKVAPAVLARPALPGQPSPANDCDRLAQVPRRWMGRFPAFADGVEFGRIDAAAAVAACQRAIRDYPGEPRFRSWLGRALEQSGRLPEAVASYRQAADQGFAPALVCARAELAMAARASRSE